MLIIFDLDGTLIDSAQDLAISMNATRQHFGMAPLDPNLIYSFVGNGAAMLVRRALGEGASEEWLTHALEFFLKYYRGHALEHTRLYPGIRELLGELTATGHQLAVLTNKPAKISLDIMGGLGLGGHFAHVYGGDSFPAKKPDPIGIESLLKQTGARREEALMVGDSGVDIRTARNAGIASCGVAWGFQPEAFRADAPDVLIREPGELVQAIASLNSSRPDAK